MLPKFELRVEPSIVLLHCRQREHLIDCDIHGVTIKKPNQYEFKVACPFQNSYNRVRKIVFEKSKVEFLPKTLFNTLRNVQKAQINHVTLKSLHPEAFLYAKYLETLDLSYNLLKLLGPREFKGATALRILDLNSNQIHFIDDAAFDGLSALETLALKRNQLKYISSSTLAPLILLKKFDLSENYLTKILQEFCNNRSLVELKLDSNGLQDLKCRDAYIESLSLSGNQLNHIPTDTFLVIKGLSKLDISYNLVNNPNFALLNDNITLKHLNLSYNGIKSLNENSFINLVNIKILDVSHNQLEVFDVFIITHLKNLEGLYIEGNSLVHFDFLNLKNTFSKLKFISIADNKWTCHYFDNILKLFCTTNITIKYENGIACTEGKNDVMIPIHRSPKQNVNRRGVRFSEHIWFYFLLLFVASISFYLAFFFFKKYCFNRILLA